MSVTTPFTAASLALGPSSPRPGTLNASTSTLSGSTSKSKRSSIYDRSVYRKVTGAETSEAAYAFLFSEMVSYAQKRVKGVTDLERKLNENGYRVGQRALELVTIRAAAGQHHRRETRVVNVLQFIQTQIWKALFNKPADDLQKSSENEDEYMIIDNDPLVSKYISVPKDMGEFTCASFMAGIVEAALDGSQFPARVTAHTVPLPQFPQRTVILVKLDPLVLEREGFLK
ncbi:hypothetical protein G7K_0759-t1 [Saitoella complicata NRRL Y-17804]|uniref:Trafficking protein particle complex subunit n=2 Tax=Saitoella complicata (strain BCRC 22490 / CBS 7301 / JCM 7358 / NBRC 10748 / NRRL Y-17804) TaxID=698492 RepID=A0A0E9N9M7_SAICN|nr:hypothetical protein G7K_0759-t1 [Saitoella complicata NRRL Y-17804]